MFIIVIACFFQQESSESTELSLLPKVMVENGSNERPPVDRSKKSYYFGWQRFYIGRDSGSPNVFSTYCEHRVILFVAKFIIIAIFGVFLYVIFAHIIRILILDPISEKWDSFMNKTTDRWNRFVNKTIDKLAKEFSKIKIQNGTEYVISFT